MRASLTSLLVSGLAGLAGASLIAAAGTYKPAGEIAVGGAPAFDYLAVDSAARRLYVSHGTEVAVLDLNTGAVAGTLADTPGVHGIAIAADLGRVFTTNGRENAIGIFDRATGRALGKIASTGANPDAILYDAAEQRIWAFNHTGHSATVIAAASGTVVGTVPLSGTAETGAIDPALHRVFVNIESASAIDVIDTTSLRVVATWPVAPGADPTGLAIDPASHRLFVGAASKMVLMDATNGHVVTSVPLCQGTDATVFDPGTQLAMSSCADGHVTIARFDAPNTLTTVQVLDTVRSARTMAVDPASHRIYTAAARGVGRGAPAEPASGSGPAAPPDSLRVFIYGLEP